MRESNKCSATGLSDQPDKKGGLYIHVPFCIQKCLYCDFYSVTETKKTSDYIQSVETELSLVAGKKFIFDTLYLGGGTPSILSPGHVDRLINAAGKYFCISPDAQVTLEANPGTLTPEKLNEYLTAGINRINIGIQSFHDDHLTFMGRIHTARQGLAAYAMAQKAGFDNIGLDLIYGLPGQTQKMWHADLKTAVDLSPEHLSCYMLTYEKGTPLEQQLQNRVFSPLDDKITSRLFLDTISFLESRHYLQYEISNFAKTDRGSDVDYRSTHNMKYWNFAPYLGFGPSAHSFSKSKRWWNHRRLDTYQEKINQRQLPIEETECLDRSMMMTEVLYLGFRQTMGIDLNDFQQRFDVRFEQMFHSPIKGLASEGFLILSKDRCRLLPKGMLYLDSIVKQFVHRIE